MFIFLYVLHLYKVIHTSVGVIFYTFAVFLCGAHQIAWIYFFWWHLLLFLTTSFQSDGDRQLTGLFITPDSLITVMLLLHSLTELVKTEAVAEVTATVNTTVCCCFRFEMFVLGLVCGHIWSLEFGVTDVAVFVFLWSDQTWSHGQTSFCLLTDVLVFQSNSSLTEEFGSFFHFSQYKSNIFLQPMLLLTPLLLLS